MSIGKWIVAVFILFAVFIGTLVTICVRQDISLVSKNYYDDELAYQDQIKRISNAEELEHQPTLSKTNDKIKVQFDQPVEKGILKLFCPSNAKMDRDFELNLSTDNQQTVDISELSKGMYRAKLYWTAAGENYYIEQMIYL